MPPETATSDPGGMTVPPLFGWEAIALVLVLVVVLAVVFVVLGALRAGRGDRAEWQAWLDARSGTWSDAVPEPDDRRAG